MQLSDVNVLVYAFNERLDRHAEFHEWLTEQLESAAAFGYSELVLSGFVRVVTHPRVFDPPGSLADALSFVEAIRGRANAVRLGPGERHWEIFTSLCRAGSAKGNLVAEAYHAALAIETGSEWITTDRSYARFPGLRWRHPLVPAP